MGLTADLAYPQTPQAPAHPPAATPEASLSGLAATFLEAVYSRELALYPYSTSLRDGSYVSTFADARAVRYTINSLLGLREAAVAGGDSREIAIVDERVDAFLTRHAPVANPGDRGLLLVLMAHRGDEDEIASTLSETASAAEAGLNVQELAWVIWGACAAARAGVASAEPVAHRSLETLLARYVDLRSGLTRHVPGGYRRNVVSFGSTVYYLRALHEYGSTFDHRISLELFDRVVQSMIDVQGPLGEWPWLIDVASGKPVDPYPIFTVHQDSMAMLFLHPALDGGAPGAKAAIARSLAWVFGENEVATPMITREPIVAYRSLERRDIAPRARRYLRARREPSGEWTRATVRINRECRSYHLGWILFVWSSREDPADLPWSRYALALGEPGR